MNEINETNQAKNNLINLFSNNLKELAIKYTKTIAKNDIGGGLNILKNIEMVIKIIRDIQENENLSVILGDISSVWESLDSTDEISKAMLKQVTRKDTNAVKGTDCNRPPARQLVLCSTGCDWVAG